MWGWLVHRYARIVDYTVDRRDSPLPCYKATAYGPEVPCSNLPDWLVPREVASWHPVGKGDMSSSGLVLRRVV